MSLLFYQKPVKNTYLQALSGAQIMSTLFAIWRMDLVYDLAPTYDHFRIIFARPAFMVVNFVIELNRRVRKPLKPLA